MTSTTLPIHRGKVDIPLPFPRTRRGGTLKPNKKTVLHILRFVQKSHPTGSLFILTWVGVVSTFLFFSYPASYCITYRQPPQAHNKAMVIFLHWTHPKLDVSLSSCSSWVGSFSWKELGLGPFWVAPGEPRDANPQRRALSVGTDRSVSVSQRSRTAVAAGQKKTPHTVGIDPWRSRVMLLVVASLHCRQKYYWYEQDRAPL